MWPHALFFLLAMMIGLLSLGLYSSRQRAGVKGTIMRIAAASLGSFFLLAQIYYVMPSQRMGRGVLGLMVLIGFAGCVTSRLLMMHIVDDRIFKRRILVYGSGSKALSLTRLRRRADNRGFELVGFLSNDGDDLSVVPKDRILPKTVPLLHLCRQLQIDEIVIAMDDHRRSFPASELMECRLSDVAVLDLPTFLERETGKVRLDVLSPSWIIFGTGFSCGSVRRFNTRALDIIASLLLLVVAIPLMACTVLAIKIEDGIRAPVLYRQKRVGLKGRTFDVLKFRSMRVDAERDGEVRWAEKKDRRVTRVGSISRTIRLDELPQIFNVLKGEMSFVGPRPERPEFVAQLIKKIPYYSERHCVKPGITGWAQVCYPYGSSEQDALEKLQLDLFYVKNHSLVFDLSILMQTAEVILWRKGSR